MKSLLILLLVQTLYGPIEGIERDSVMAYLGIPFAQPPTDEWAFRAPRPVTSWDTVLIANKGSKNCPQLQNKYSTKNTGLDCLYLNIFVPAERLPEGLTNRCAERPVIVWFHGGAFTHGGAGNKVESESESELMYELGLFARETNTIVVSCNYRLNVYGFLNLHDFSNRFDSNIGVRDQLQALQFVHEIIPAFGGDTSNIVIMGQSAGAASVINLMALEQAQPLFAKAIAFSPCIDHFLSVEHSRKRTKKYLSYLGLNTHHVDKLLSLPIDKIEKAASKYYRGVILMGETRCPFAPYIDGDLFTDYPYLTARECTKPLLITYTREESRMFTQNVPHGLFPLYASLARDYAQHNGLPKFEVAKGDTPYWVRLNEALTDYMFHAPIDTFIAHYKGPIEHYEYTYVPQEGEHLGCYHWSDMPVLFGWDYKTSPQSNPLTRQKGKELREMIATFVTQRNSNQSVYPPLCLPHNLPR